MADQYIRGYDYNRPEYRVSNAPLIFAILMLPVFFFFGFVASEAMNTTGGNGLELGIGGGPEIRETEIVSPTPDSVVPTVTPTQEPTPSPTTDVTPATERDMVE